ncbi:hypothetical protein QQ045_031493 [Rhodiola kirilowii]
MRVILFPKGVLKKVPAICRNFLWSGAASGKRNLVAWKEVCKPKMLGGLGLKNLCLYNKTLLLGQIWDILLKKDSMWIRLMNGYYFKDQSIWHLVDRSHLFWVQKKILMLAGVLSSWIISPYRGALGTILSRQRVHTRSLTVGGLLRTGMTLFGTFWRIQNTAFVRGWL